MVSMPPAFTVREYLDAHGRSPFRDWLNTLDTATSARIQARILRFENGNLGDYKHVGGGVYEARMHFGPGYRVYFGKAGRDLVLLLLGGDKGSQRKDVNRAQQLWRGYLEDLNLGKT